MKPGNYIQPTTGGWAAIQVLPARKVEQREPRREKLIDSFTGPGSKARAIQAAGTNRVLDRGAA